MDRGYDQRWVGTHAAAEHLGLSLWGVYRLVRARRIPLGRIGRHLRYRQSDIERWLDEQRDPR